jgi:predicted lipoprotein
MIYVPSFIEIGSGIQMLMGRNHRQPHRQHGDSISLLSFSQNKESRLKRKEKSWKGEDGGKKEEISDFLSTDPYRNGKEVFCSTLSIWITQCEMAG